MKTMYKIFTNSQRIALVRSEVEYLRTLKTPYAEACLKTIKKEAQHLGVWGPDPEWTRG